jgi:hypothetical protein
MDYDTDSAIELERLREFKRQRYPRAEGTPAIKMIIGEWYVDELGFGRERSRRANSGR